MKRKYTNKQFKQAVQNSFSIAEVLKKLKLKPCGGNYRSFQNLVKELNLDTSHFTGQRWNKGKTFGPKRPISDYLSNRFSITSYKLKNRLIKEGYFERVCNQCKLKTWNGLPIPLELEHIDGNHQNNNLDNLCLLCPNCHAQTSTYRGKNIKS